MRKLRIALISFLFITKCIVSNAQCTRPGAVSSFLWLRADAGVTGTTTVTNWADQSGNSRHVAQSTSSNCPSLTNIGLNFNPTLTFDGVNDYLARSSVYGTSSQTDLQVYFVGKTTDLAKSNCVFREQGANTNVNSAAHGPSQNNHEIFVPAGNIVYYDAGENDYDPVLNAINQGYTESNFGGVAGYSYLWTGNSTTGSVSPSGQKQAIYRDGELLATSHTGSESNSTPFVGNNSNFDVGRQNKPIEDPTGAYFGGDMAELIIVNGVTNATRQRRIHSYLAIKYGISINQNTAQNYTASDNTVIWNAAANSAYKTAITGIGRDDTSCLNQKQSVSANNADIVTIGLSTIATSNALNSNTFPSNKSFFIWGSDNSALAALGVTDFDATVLQGRMARVWKAQETGSVGTLKVRFDLSAIRGVNNVIGANDLANVRLLVDADGVFSTGTTYVSPSSFNNTTDLAEFDIDFTSSTGFFFAIGTTNISVTPLPITLMSYEATLGNEGVLLQWTASNHYNSSYFIIERSTNGIDWETVGTTPSKNTNGAQSYSLTDYYYKHETNYYRLIEVSTNGERENYGVRAVEITLIKELDWHIQPNPNKGHFNINLIDKLEEQGYEITFYNMIGQELAKTKIYSGLNTLDLSHFSAGTYVAKLKTGKTFLTKKLILF